MRETAHIWTWTTTLELCWLAEYASQCVFDEKRRPNFIEIGSYNGRSAKVMLLANPKMNILSLDTWDDGNLPNYRHNLGPEIAASRVITIKGESQDTLKTLINVEFAGCFIDGGHLEHLVKADIENVMPLMKPGSLMAGHDFSVKDKNDVYRGVISVLQKVENPVDSIWAYQL